MRLQLRWTKTKISKGVEPKVLEDARKLARNHPKGELGLKFTESNPEWTLLYNHAQIGQIDPAELKFMKRKDLKFLAGHTFPHPALVQPKSKREKMISTKLVINQTEKNWDRIT